MKNNQANTNSEVTQFLDDLHHPLRPEIELLRLTILSAVSGVQENIKWNGPNYYFEGEDRITMKIQPPKQIQLIFHRGAKKIVQPKNKIVDDKSGLLVWKENDRAVASFMTMGDIEKCKPALKKIVHDWIKATKTT